MQFSLRMPKHFRCFNQSISGAEYLGWEFMYRDGLYNRKYRPCQSHEGSIFRAAYGVCFVCCFPIGGASFPHFARAFFYQGEKKFRNLRISNVVHELSHPYLFYLVGSEHQTVSLATVGAFEDALTPCMRKVEEKEEEASRENSL